MLKAIMFDLDDTLLWDHRSVEEALEQTCEMAIEKYNIEPEQLKKSIKKHAPARYKTYPTYDFVSNIGIGAFEAMWGEFKDGGEDFAALRAILEDYRVSSWSLALNDFDIEDEALARELAASFPEKRKGLVYLFDETIDVLEKLKDDYKLLMLTNGSPDLQQTKLKMSPELVPYFNHIVISGEFGEGKPSEAIFKHALNLLDVEKSEVIMVGDNPNTDILGALQTGIDSVFINLKIREKTNISATYEVSRLKEVLNVVKDLSKE